MDQSVNLKLPYVMPYEVQKHLSHNEAIARLDALVQLAVLDRDLSAPPGSPAEGSRYLVAAGATGAWNGWTNSIAHYVNGTWERAEPRIGWLVYVVDELALLSWDGSSWVGFSGVSASSVPFTPSGGISATTVQAALTELDSEKAVVSWGSNANGLYVRYSNGIQRCIKTVTVPGTGWSATAWGAYVNAGTGTWAMAFNAVPDVAVGVTESAIATRSAYVTSLTASASGISALWLAGHATAGSNVVVTLVAEGTW